MWTREFNSTGSGFEEAASMMAAAAHNECPTRFACADVVGAEKSGCLDRDGEHGGGEVPNFLDLSGLMHFSED